MKKWKMNSFVAVIVIGAVLSTASCGYILHPERRNAHTNRLDSLTVTFDCLWLLAGIIPGVVALIVDGVKDTWYFAPTEKAELDLHKDQLVAVGLGSELAVEVNAVAEIGADVTLRLLDESGSELVPGVGTRVQAGHSMKPLALLVDDSVPAGRAKLALFVDGHLQLSRAVEVHQR
jgi:hypothetical protein